MDQEAFPYSVKPTKKLTVSDVQKIVSGHWKREARTSGFFHQSMRDICNVGTFESVVYEMNPEPLLTRGWRTSALSLIHIYLFALRPTGRLGQSKHLPDLHLAKYELDDQEATRGWTRLAYLRG